MNDAATIISTATGCTLAEAQNVVGELMARGGRVPTPMIYPPMVFSNGPHGAPSQDSALGASGVPRNSPRWPGTMKPVNGQQMTNAGLREEMGMSERNFRALVKKPEWQARRASNSTGG